MIKENVTCNGIIEITHRSASGKIKSKETTHNRYVDAGSYHAAALISGTGDSLLTDLMVAMELGLSGATPVPGDDSIVANTVTATRQPFDGPPTRNGNEITYECTYTGIVEDGIQEAVIINNSVVGTGGTILCRGTFKVKNMEAGDSLGLIWKVSIIGS